MSVFLAVDLDAPTRALAAGLIETHRAMFPGAKWLRTDKLHCTVVFLGNPTPEQLASRIPAITALACDHGPFQLRLQGAGTFVTARAPSVLWLGVAGQVEPLTRLHLDALTRLGLEERPFVPHVTLARTQVPAGFDALSVDLNGFVSADFRVEALSLYESSSEVYRVVQSWPLNPTLSPHGGRGS